jgi:hypothetical protein
VLSEKSGSLDLGVVPARWRVFGLGVVPARVAGRVSAPPPACAGTTAGLLVVS